MSRRPDGVVFFTAEGNAVAKMIYGQSLPKEIEEAITAPLPASGGVAGYGDRFTTNAVVGNANLELIRTNSDNGFTSTFQF